MSIGAGTVLIIGAGGGNDTATARELHRRGAHLVPTDISGASTARLAAEFGDGRAQALRPISPTLRRWN